MGFLRWTRRVAGLGRLSRAALLALAAASSAGPPATAHEVLPSVLDFEARDGRLEMTLETVLEAPLAGLDLTDLADTNAAAGAADYDRLRALPPAELEARLRAAWPGIARQFTLEVDGTALVPDLGAVAIPETGDPALPRVSRLALSAALPPGAERLTLGWAAELGGLVVRQEGVAEPYDDYLTGGRMSEPVAIGGGSARSFGADLLRYVPVGFDHIVPKGLDHILFVLGLFFLAPRMRPLLVQVTMFTLAHTVTLALGTLGVVEVPPAVVEPLIAASIAYVGIENVLARGMTPWRPAVVFGFGLLHGLGFASVLREFGLGQGNLAAELIGFNVGVELGQLAVIAAAWLLLASWAGQRGWYRGAVAVPASLAIAAVGGWWAVERAFLA